jgi:hypothetical protein
LKGWLPLVGSVVLVALLIIRVSPTELAHAFAQLNWCVLIPLTAALVLVAFFWDSICVWCLFVDPQRHLSYGEVLHARAMAYLLAIINHGAGQGMLAWKLAKLQRKTFVSGVGRCLLLAYVDAVVLLSLGFIGALACKDPRAKAVMAFCGVGVAAMVALTVTLRLLPASLKTRLLETRWGARLDLREWSWQRVRPICALRVVYFALGAAYAVTGLAICGVGVDHVLVLSVFPVATMADALPVSVSGLGTRETALLLLLRPEQPAILLAFCLVWSASVIVGRAMIGIGCFWLPQISAWVRGGEG